MINGISHQHVLSYNPENPHFLPKKRADLRRIVRALAQLRSVEANPLFHVI